MTARRIVGAVVVVVAILLAPAVFSASGQDKDSDRADLLETRVAILETAVFGSSPSAADTNATPGVITSDESTRVIGAGSVVVGPFNLDAGRYAVTINVGPTARELGFFAVLVTPDSGERAIESIGPFYEDNHTGTTMVDLAAGGEHFIATSTTDANWVIAFEPI